MSETVVRARGVRKRFADREVVCGVDFDIEPGICFGLLGPNGAGKTTLVRMLQGLTPITGGDYTLFGEPAGWRQHGRLGVVPQFDNLDPDFSVRDNLLVYSNYFGIARAVAERRADELLDFAELAGRADSQVSSLSGGMRRRLMVARALVNDPDLVILDEPSTGLDPQSRHMIWQRLRSLKRQGKTLILTTHYMEEAEQLCDDLIIIDRGSILDRGAPRDLIRRHVEPDVVALRGDGANSETMDALCAGLALRRELVGDTWYCYMQDAKQLLDRCAAFPELSFVHRPANLEDVFLTLTGRDMRD